MAWIDTFIRRGGQGYFRWQLFGLVIPLLGLVGFVASRAAFGGSRLLVCAGQASISATLDGAPLVFEGSSTVRSAEVKTGKHRLELEREGGHMSHDLEVGRWSDLLVSTGPAQCFVWFTRDHGSVRIVARFPEPGRSTKWRERVSRELGDHELVASHSTPGRLR